MCQVHRDWMLINMRGNKIRSKEGLITKIWIPKITVIIIIQIMSEQAIIQRSEIHKIFIRTEKLYN
jgi:hypothetical protein